MNSGYVAMDPDRVTLGADHLRRQARLIGDLDCDIRRATLLAEADSVDVLSACAELEEELTILATLLSVRAAEASGHVVPGSGWDFETDLLHSLVDDRGHRATVAGPLALALLLDAGVGVVGEGDDAAISVAAITEIATDPTTDPVLAEAAAFLSAHPFLVADAIPLGRGGHFGVASGAGVIPLDGVRLFLARNDMIAATLTGLGPSSRWSQVTDADLIGIGIEPSAFDALELPRDSHDLTVAAIHHGTFTHSPDQARAFLATLPVHRQDGRSIRFGAVGTEAAARLHDAATADLPDASDHEALPEHLIARWEVIAHLPETTTGLRNGLITEAYADIAHLLGAPINGDRPPTDPDFRGHNWFHLGVVASASVRPIIVGDVLVYGNQPSLPVRAEIADGNQAIFAHFSTELSRHLNGEPLGTPEMERAFDLLADAAATDDIGAAQMAMAESSALLALVEQHVVDPYLQLDALSRLERLGTPVATLLGGELRSAEEVMTDMGVLAFEVGGLPVREAIAIGSPVATPTQENNVADVDEVLHRLPEDHAGRPIDWSLEVAEDWSRYGDRMPIIARVAVATLTDPALTMVTDAWRSGG